MEGRAGGPRRRGSASVTDPGEIAALRHTMLRLAFAVAALTAVSLPLGYFTVSFGEASNFLNHLAHDAAERLARLTGALGRDWSLLPEEQLAQTAGAIRDDHGPLHWVVTAADGRTLAHGGPAFAWPRLEAAAAVALPDGSRGTVTLQASMTGLVLKTVSVGLFAVVLGLAAFLVLFVLPLRALDATLSELKASLRSVEAHAAETTFAYEELKHQHRLVEETTQDLMRARDEALAADRTKSAFLATMSHELRTPLNAIIGMSEMLSLELFGPLGAQRYREYSQAICESGRHLLAIVNDVLDLSRVATGKLQLHPEDIDLAAQIESSCRLVRDKAFETGIELQVEPPAEPVVALRADPVRLKQILLNLLSNAVKFSPTGGRITISSGIRNGTDAYVTVADTGIGMSPADVAIALLPFRQVDNSHTRKYEGTGLGLPLSKALAEGHGGQLEIVSHPGRGTAVTVVLPLGIARSTPRKAAG